MYAERPHKIKNHASKMTAFITPRSNNPTAQRRSTIYFPFEYLVLKGYLRSDWEHKAITFEEYMDAVAREELDCAHLNV